MIKAKDLMIGDYINSSFGIAQVISIDKVGVTLINKDNGEFDIDFLDNDAWLQEIILTPEILEKNGFEVSRRKKYFLVPNDPSLAIKREPIIGSHGNTFLIGHFVEENHFEDFIEIAYLHELQHAIRLCGIDKEIEL